MSNPHGRKVNVEQGKQGFQETQREVPSVSFGLGASAVGDTDTLTDLDGSHEVNGLRTPNRHTRNPDELACDFRAMMDEEKSKMEALSSRYKTHPPVFAREHQRGFTANEQFVEAVKPFMTSSYVPSAYLPKGFPEDGEPTHYMNEFGTTHFSGLDSKSAMDVLGSLPVKNRDQHLYDGGPSVRNILETTALNPGKVETFGYVVGPERLDERFHPEGVRYFSDTATTADEARAELKALGLKSRRGADDVELIEDTAWRPGEKHWRVRWEK